MRLHLHHVQGTHWISISKYDRFNYARVWGREKPPTDVIPLRAGDLCPRSSLRVSEAACTLVEYVNARLCTLWMHADVHAGEERRGGGGGDRTDTGWLMEKFSPQRKPLYHLPTTLYRLPLLLPFHQERLCFSISDNSPLYLEFIWCGSSGA